MGKKLVRARKDVRLLRKRGEMVILRVRKDYWGNGYSQGR